MVQIPTSPNMSHLCGQNNGTKKSGSPSVHRWVNGPHPGGYLPSVKVLMYAMARATGCRAPKIIDPNKGRFSMEHCGIVAGLSYWKSTRFMYLYVYSICIYICYMYNLEQVSGLLLFFVSPLPPYRTSLRNNDLLRPHFLEE